MARHATVVSMLRASLPEYLTAARLCIDYEKADGGCLGYPAALTLLSIIDALGSYYLDSAVMIGGKKHVLKKASHHVYALNTPAFRCDFSLAQLREIQDAARSILVHSALVAPGWTLMKVDPPVDAFRFDDDGRLQGINLPALLHNCERAVAYFLAEADRIVPGGKVERNMHARAKARRGKA